MVFCSPAAVGAVVGGGATAGATALGLKLDKQGVDLTRECFLMQMRQAKRLFTAQWAEGSYRHGEAIAQAAQQHAEAQALATAQYFQAERIHTEDMKLSRDQDMRNFEMAWRTEARESLRDELTNQFNRYNIIMLCDTVCMGCIMPLVESGSPPEETSQLHLALYLVSMGSAIMFFVISLWFSVIVVRRLHEHTASILERKLFADSEQLQKLWQDQIENDLPTGPDVMNLLNQAYRQWLAYHIQPLGNASIQTMTIGILFLFCTAGLLTHARYYIDYDAPVAVGLFWTTVSIAAFIVIFFKQREDAKDRIKVGCYDKSWLDIPTTIGPMAKIAKAEDQLYTSSAVRLGSRDRRDQYKQQEREERSFVAQTEALHAKADSLLTEADKRATTRKNVLQALTAATEELDALPEDLIAHLNDLIHQVEHLDNKTAEAVAMPSKYRFSENSDMDCTMDEDDDSLSLLRARRMPMHATPIDANRTAVSLTSLRSKLGEVALTTLIRIRNVSEEPLRLKSGVQLRSGRYVKEIDLVLLADRNRLRLQAPGSKVTYHLFPIEEIPPRTEVTIAARSNGANWLPTSGIEGELIFTNTRQTWAFHINFSNSLKGGNRMCKVNATAQSVPADTSGGIWHISNETIDHRNNHEVFVAIDKRHRAGGNNRIQDSFLQSSPGHQKEDAPSPTTFLEETGVLNSNIPWMTGFLSLQVVGLRALWQEKWCTLTSRAMTFSIRSGGKEELEVLLKDVTKVEVIPNAMYNYVFDVYTTQRQPVRLAAATLAERDQWIRKISDAKGRDVADWGEHHPFPISADIGDHTLTRADTNSGTSTDSDSEIMDGTDSEWMAGSDTEVMAGAGLFLTPTGSARASRENGGQVHSFDIETLPV